MSFCHCVATVGIRGLVEMFQKHQDSVQHTEMNLESGADHQEYMSGYSWWSKIGQHNLVLTVLICFDHLDNECFFQISSDWHSGKCDEKHEFNSITFPLFQSISQKKLAPSQLSTPWRARPLWDKSTAFHAADPRRTWGPVVDAPR